MQARSGPSGGLDVGVVRICVGVVRELRVTAWFLPVHKQGGTCRWQILEVTLKQELAWL